MGERTEWQGRTVPTPVRDHYLSEGWWTDDTLGALGTGDMGVLDADGFFTITDRLNDVIIRGGENISAAEVGQAIASLEPIAEVAVVAAPDSRLGEHAARRTAGCGLPLG